MNNGYWGKVLRVDLTESQITEESISEAVMKTTIGGAGFGAKVLYDEVPASVQPLDPENRIIFAVGPFQAANITGSAKFSIVSRSPLTGIYADSAAGGNWGIGLKKAGYDALIIQGKAKKPVYLWINDGKAEIKDASNVWGNDTFEATDAILKEIGDEKASIACIGKAGEKLVAIACVVVDKHSFAGRCGLGAVMGSKNLKAVVVNGTKSCPVYNKEKVADLSKRLGKIIADNMKDFLRAHGTAAVVVGSEEAGDMPVKYWSEAQWKEGARKIGAPYATEVLGCKPVPCAYCTAACHNHVKVEEPTKYAMEGPGPEYETLGMFGSNCLIDDIRAIAKANDLCSRYGIDTISAGGFAGFTMECFERGILKKEDTGGFFLNWGDADGLIEFINKIGNREGYIGELFAKGIVFAAKKLGKGAETLAVHTKGLDTPAHDPRAYHSLYINYATGNRGGCHERGNPQVASMGALLTLSGINKVINRFSKTNTEFVAAKYQDYSALTNALCHCKFMLFGGMGEPDLLEVLNAITGWGWNKDQYVEAGERVFNLQRMVNVKYGVKRKDDTIPKRLFAPSKDGSRAGKAFTEREFQDALDKYYKLRGWDREGRPTIGTLHKLKINIRAVHKADLPTELDD